MNWYRGIAVATVSAFFLVASGAFGTSDLPVGTRFIFWFAIMESAALIGIGMSSTVAAWGRLRSRPWLEGALVSLGVSVPVTIVVVGVEILVGRLPPSVPQLLGTFAIVLLITGIVTLLNYLVAVRSALPVADGTGDPRDEPNPRPDGFGRLRERLSPALRNAHIQALQAEDHYLRVHTDNGSELVLMRFTDAIAEAMEADGLQTHRSWWVARSAVADAARTGDRAAIRLESGIQAPVSRTYVRRLSAAGWFQSDAKRNGPRAPEGS